YGRIADSQRIFPSWSLPEADNMGESKRHHAQAAILLVLGGWLGACFPADARGEELIVSSPIRELKIVQGALPAGDAKRPELPTPINSGQEIKAEDVPYVVIDGPGEGYLDAAWPAGQPSRDRTTWPLSALGHVFPDDVVSVRVPAAPDGREI